MTGMTGVGRHRLDRHRTWELRVAGLDSAGPKRSLGLGSVAWRRGRSVLLAVILLCTMVAGARGGRPKHLIEMGWDEPDPAFMRQHLAELEATPFDGCAYDILYAKPGGGTGRFTW